MEPILTRLQAGQTLICDGGMGTMLQARGLQPGECPELWNIDRPADVQAVHREYRQAGSRIVECNSFGASRQKLSHFGLGERAAEINRAAAEIAKAVAGDDQYVLGSMGPTGEFLQPLGTASEDDLYGAFAEQASALADGGADVLIVETMTAIEEAALAVRAAKDRTDLPVIASFTFDPQARGGYATMMGVTPEGFATVLKQAGADILGANCGTGPDHMIRIIEQLRQAAPDTPLMAMPNAGMPEIENGQTVFKLTPADMAERATKLVAAGASILGGCCGTTPAHIAAMATAVK